MSYTITPEQHTEISTDLAGRIASKIGTKVWVQTNYGTVSSSTYGTLTKPITLDSGWDYRLNLEDGLSMVLFNIEDCYSVLSNTIFLGIR
jgi:hypothetical protein